VKERGELLGLNPKDEVETILIRLGCMLRFYDKEMGNLLKQNFTELQLEEKEMILHQFDLNKGFNLWERNPTYMPAVLVNAFNFNKDNMQISKEERVKNALKVATCIANITNYFSNKILPGSSISVEKADNPVSFNQLAGEAAKDLYKFINEFNVEKVKIVDYQLQISS
jgi:hypothetical protein